MSRSSGTLGVVIPSLATHIAHIARKRLHGALYYLNLLHFPENQTQLLVRNIYVII